MELFMRPILIYISVAFIVYISALIITTCSSYIYYNFTHPSWDKLSGIIAPNKILIIKSKHDKADGYHAEFRIHIPHTEDIRQFICSIERIGSKSLIRKEKHANGETEYYFPIEEMWVHIIGKDGHYFVEYTYMFDYH